MREIKFRGKRTDNSEWVYGGYFSSSEEEGLVHYIFCSINGAEPVTSETIGQFTGLKDKNGVDIYESDYFIIGGTKYIVEWQNDACRYVLTTGHGYDSRNCFDLTCDSIYDFEVIGNIHKNH